MLQRENSFEDVLDMFYFVTLLW